MFNSVFHRHVPYLAGLTVLLLMAVSIPVLAEGEKVQWGTSIAEATSQATETGKPIMMDFYTDWWGWCKRLDADTFTDARIVTIAENFIPVKVNPEIKEQPANEEARKKYGVRGFPAILFIAPDGGVIKNHSGYAAPDEFLPVMEDVLKKEAEFQEKLAKFMEKPDDPKLNREIAILYLKRQQIDKALPISKKMPDDVELNREFGIFYLGKNEIDKALLISKKMPNDVELNREFGFFYLSKNEIGKALLISEKMPNDVKLNHKIAVTYLQQKKIKKALPFSERVFEKDPENISGLLPDMHMQIGLTYVNLIQGKAEGVAAESAKMAEMHFQKVINTYPKSSVYDFAQYYLGVTYSLDGQLDKSIAVLEKLMNHTTNERLKQGAEKVLTDVKKSSAEAADEGDN